MDKHYINFNIHLRRLSELRKYLQCRKQVVHLPSYSTPSHLFLTAALKSSSLFFNHSCTSPYFDMPPQPTLLFKPFMLMFFSLYLLRFIPFSALLFISSSHLLPFSFSSSLCPYSSPYTIALFLPSLHLSLISVLSFKATCYSWKIRLSFIGEWDQSSPLSLSLSHSRWAISGKSSSAAEGCSDHIKSTSYFTPETVWNSTILIKTAWAHHQTSEHWVCKT